MIIFYSCRFRFSRNAIDDYAVVRTIGCISFTLLAILSGQLYLDHVVRSYGSRVAFYEPGMPAVSCQHRLNEENKESYSNLAAI